MSEIYHKIIQMAEEMKPNLSKQRRCLHQYPELGWCEMRTSSLIARKLKDFGYDEVLVGKDVCDAASRMGLPPQEELELQYRRAEKQGADPEFLPATRGGFTGVIGILHCGEGPTVALRFDIDALPLAETLEPSHLPNALGFSSRNPGVMHACGHDGHTTIGLGTAKILVSIRDQLHGTLKLIFQPAEEGVRGAKSIVEKGHLDGVDYVLGAHLNGGTDKTAGSIGAGRGTTLATTKMDVTFSGKAAHAGMSPEKGKNAMLAAVTAVLNLHAIPRFGDAATRVNVGKLTAGSGRNMICDHAKLELEVRGNTAEANQYMEDYAHRIVCAAAAMHDCKVKTEFVGSAKCSLNSPELSELVRKVILEKAGIPTLSSPDGLTGSEDYSYFSERVQQQGGQSCYFLNIVHCAGPFHNPEFDFDEVGLVNGVKAFSVMSANLMNA